MRSLPLLGLVPALLLSGVLSSCTRAKNMPTGKPPEKKQEEVVLSTPEIDRRVGEEEAKKVGGAMGLVEDPKLVGYVKTIGQRLAHHAPSSSFQYEFQIVDDDVPNAFALPGGFIYVSRGLLILANSEAEIANVLGHEIIHVASRHAAGRQAVIQGLGVIRIFAMGAIASYGRDQEREADRLGQNLAAATGYDPKALATFLRDLEFTERLQLGGSRLPGFLDTHPTTSERVAMASARAHAIRFTPQAPIAPDRAAYLAFIRGLPVGTAASEGVFQGDRFLHPDLDFMLRFPDGWKTVNTRQAVGAISPRRDAQVFLEHQGAGDDPEHAAAEFLENSTQEGAHVELDRSQPLEINGFKAYRAEGHVSGAQGGGQLTLTWIARGGSIFRITGIAGGPGRGGKYRGAFLSVARSFRPLPPAAKTTIREQRLAIVDAREGESVKQLSMRTGNQWDIQTTAVMNDVFANAVLSKGQPMKVALAVRYQATQ